MLEGLCVGCASVRVYPGAGTGIWQSCRPIIHYMQWNEHDPTCITRQRLTKECYMMHHRRGVSTWRPSDMEDMGTVVE